MFALRQIAGETPAFLKIVRWIAGVIVAFLLVPLILQKDLPILNLINKF
ncbi:MAG: hypothetical protein LBP59_12325 [Planctomycetaceae bacterium]|nr:hypothetical protein [Planctomycetaceae bacterium]